MIAMFAKPAVAALLLVATGPTPPHLDIRRTCEATAGGDGVRRCAADERDAERKLRKHWTRIPLAFKQECLLDPLPPSPSYMVLRDCINNNEMTRKSKPQ